MKQKICSKCQHTYPRSEFYKDKNCSDGRMGYCKHCYKAKYAASHRVRATQYYERNREAEQAKKRDRVNKKYRNRIANAKNAYGITEDEMRDHLDAQKGCCKICSRDFSELTIEYHIDHCHDTGEVRGLLCPACNTALGLIETHKINPKKIIEYLNLHYEWL